ILWGIAVLLAIITIQIHTYWHLHVPAWAQAYFVMDCIVTNFGLSCALNLAYYFFGRQILQACHFDTHPISLTYLWIGLSYSGITHLVGGYLTVNLASLDKNDCEPKFDDLSPPPSESENVRNPALRRLVVL